MMPAAMQPTPTKPQGSPTLISILPEHRQKLQEASVERRVQNGCYHMDMSLRLFLLSHSAT